MSFASLSNQLLGTHLINLISEAIDATSPPAQTPSRAGIGDEDKAFFVNRYM